MRSFSRVLGAAVLAVTTTATGLAFGGDSLTAETLFRQGLEAMKKNQFKEACDAFLGSYDADPSPGTEINLALCNEKQNKFAAAWGWYKAAAGLADSRGQKDRADLARSEAVKLEPKLHKLVLSVKSPLPDGLVVTRNGQPVPNVTLGTEVPIDPGEYAIEANARGKKPWKASVRIGSGPGIDRQEIVLEDAPVETATPLAGGVSGGDYQAPQATPAHNTQKTIGYVTGGAGIVAGGVAIVLAVLTVKQEDKRQEFDTQSAKAAPGDKKALDEAAASHHSAAKTDQAIAIASGIGAVVLVGVGITLLVTAPSAKSSASLSHPIVVPLLGRDNAGLGLVGTF